MYYIIDCIQGNSKVGGLYNTDMLCSFYVCR